MDTEKNDNVITIFIAGDSTAANKTPEVYPESSWGEAIGQFFNEKVRISNHAMNGRSSKSFVDEGRLQAILDQIKEGDYLFIQFAHNDEKEQDPTRYTDPRTTYKQYLRMYIDGARAKRAIPVLLTPVNRRFFENGKIINTHREYYRAMKELAEEMSVPLIEVCEKRRVLFERTGEEKTKEIFLWVKPGEYPNYPNGKQDNTHFSTKGAVEIAKLVVDGIKNDIDSPLKEYLKDNA